jgi:uncharacterized protein YcfL
MLTKLLPVGLLATVAMVGCTGQIDAQQDGVQQYKQVSVDAYSLSTDIRVQPPVYERIGNGQLRVKLLVRNLRDHDLNVDYQYRFVDEAGMEVEPPTSWQHQRIARKGVAQVEFTSLTPAHGCRVEFRHAR